MYSFSRPSTCSSRLNPDSGSSPAAAGPFATRLTMCSGRLSGRIAWLFSSATARSITFSSSRMFPGHS